MGCSRVMLQQPNPPHWCPFGDQAASRKPHIRPSQRLHIELSNHNRIQPIHDFLTNRCGSLVRRRDSQPTDPQSTYIQLPNTILVKAMGWPHNRDNFSLCTCKMTRNNMHIWRESMYLQLCRRCLRVWFETQCVFHQMDTPLHKSYVHYQKKAMVPWEREKNPLCIQNRCRSNLMQSPCRK